MQRKTRKTNKHDAVQRDKYCLVLVLDISPDEAHAAGEDDWAGDSGGSDTMDKKQLNKCRFEFADMWCT
jgi:hypothetical protein|eukprot:5684532-Prymnesium_polylepis.1